MLTYLGIHLSYSIPIIGVLTLITRPFINRLEIFKIGCITTAAVLYSVPLYNYYVYNGVKTYSPESVLAVIGNVPVEEYMLVVVQSVLTSLWASMFVLWSTPCLNFNYDKRSYQLIRWLPITLLSTVTAAGYTMVVSAQDKFYLGCILLWASPAIMIMWYGAGNFFVKKIIPSSIAIAGPTLYMCWIHWTTAKNHNDSGVLALEELLFFFVTNLMVVLAGSCYDKAYGMIVTYSLDFPHQFSVSWRFVRQMLRAFVNSEYSTPSAVTQDIKTSIKVLNTSNAFGTSNYLFHAGKSIVIKNKINKVL
jgi:15-cis-phytoene synthase / lycopene beta-cyclase